MARSARIGITGLGTMGAALALDLAGRGVREAVHNRSPRRTEALMARAGPLAATLAPVEGFAGLVGAPERSRAVPIMAAAGDPVRRTFDALLPPLVEGDTPTNAGNADFNDIVATAARLREHGLNLPGIGVSGGEDRARHGPSPIIGRPEAADAPLCDIFEGSVARLDGVPCPPPPVPGSSPRGCSRQEEARGAPP